jgi:hypothetical protein
MLAATIDTGKAGLPSYGKGKRNLLLQGEFYLRTLA